MGKLEALREFETALQRAADAAGGDYQGFATLVLSAVAKLSGSLTLSYEARVIVINNFLLHGDSTLSGKGNSTGFVDGHLRTFAAALVTTCIRHPEITQKQACEAIAPLIAVQTSVNQLMQFRKKLHAGKKPQDLCEAYRELSGLKYKEELSREQVLEEAKTAMRFHIPG